ncbi:hypothetical protein VKT23_014938 [Stygiomarasmius scandens]|uniref:DUF6535 domain-containing protein n=1 Tax=Marasmiellus scandens TaxID=2682957 RepID=A0ABR1IYQ8_9AGAR
MDNVASSSKVANPAMLSPSPSRTNSNPPESSNNKPTTTPPDPQPAPVPSAESTPNQEVDNVGQAGGSNLGQEQDEGAANVSSSDPPTHQGADGVGRAGKSNANQQHARSGNPAGKGENRGILPNMPGYQSSYTGNRDYDYEKKYPPDPYGQEIGEDARIWKVYLDEAEAYDDEMLKGFRETINSLLVFAALFSAVVTTFVVQTSQALLPDYGYITANQLIEQNLLLRAAGNVTAINNIPPSPVGIDSVSFTNTDVWINGLFFTSLSLSLATALLSVLANQWLQAYTSLTSGSARDRATIRQFRLSGFEKWKMHEIIGMLPIILHLSLAVFFIGLALFVSELQHRSMSWIVVTIAAMSFGAYLGSVILPTIWIDCPYRIPVLFIPTQYILFPIHYVIYPLQTAYLSLLHRLAQHKTFYRRSNYIRRFRWTKKLDWPSFPSGSLKSTELRCLKDRYSLGRVISDAFAWLSTLESNRSIQRIAVQGLHGIIYSRSEYEPTFRHLDFEPFRRISEKSSYSIGDFVWGRYCDVDISMSDKTVFHDDLENVSERILVEENLLDQSSIEESRVSYLVEAARKGDLSIVRGMLELWKEANINGRNSRGQTALLAASEQGNFEVVKLLIDRGADVNAMNELTWPRDTPLHAAARGEHMQVFKLLVQSDANVFPLLYAIEHGTLDTVKLLMLNDDSHEWALRAAAEYQRIDIMRFVLDIEGVNVNAKDDFGTTPLQDAARDGEENIIKLLIEKGADVNVEGGRYGTALQAAACWGRLGVVKLLIAKGADVNAKAGIEGTALEAAANTGHLDIMKFLLEHGADVNAKGGKYGSAIQAARAPPLFVFFSVPEGTRNSIIDLLRQHGATD